MTSGSSALWQRTASSVAAAVRSGELSPVTVVESAVERLALVNPVLQAFCTTDVDAARAQASSLAQRIARGESVGALAGVPVGVKDLIATRGLLTTSGSVAYRDFVPDEDDIVVERLRAADAIILGKTNTSEFGYTATGRNPLFPASRNPWDTERSPGGSSAGSAAAVAGGIVPLALGSDGGGSIRIPASFCGLVGLKASMGRVPLYPGCRDERWPGMSGWESIEHIGPLTRTVADAALMLSVIAGPDPRDRHSIPCSDIDWRAAPQRSVRGLRLGYTADLGFASADAEVLDIVERLLPGLGAATGSEVQPLTLDWPDLGPTFDAIVALETDLAGLRGLIAAYPGQLSAGVLRTAERAWTADDLNRAVIDRKAACNRMWRLMGSHDVLLTPSVAVPPFAWDADGPATIGGAPAGPADDWSPFSYVANLTGQPAASVPAGITAAGLPVGIQIIGRHLDDATVLAVAAAIESLTGLQDAWPSIACA